MPTDYYQLTEHGRRNRLRAVAAAALEEYSLDVVRMRGLTDATNGVFRLDTSDGGRYAMRVGLGPPAGHTAAEFRSEMEWIRTLADQSDVVVPDPVPTRSGTYVMVASADDVPHDRPCAVFSWLEGPLLADRLTPASMHAYGATMAKMHRQAAGFAPSDGFTAVRYDTVYPYDLPFIVFSDAGDELLPPERRTLFDEARVLVEQTLEGLAAREPARILHGDFHPWNAKINRGVVAAFDFEDIVWGWPVQD
ncbi:MAG: phosphotransferase enzyme family protein, partial [Acidimicrobiia bacterium]